MIETWYRGNPKGYILRAKIWSPIYINLRPMGSKKTSKQILCDIGGALGGLISTKTPAVTRTVGLYMAGIPLASAITISTGLPSCYGRHIESVEDVADFYKKLPDLKTKLSSHGHHALVEGDFQNGDKVAIIDDLATKFNTKLIAKAQILQAAKDKGVEITCDDVVVLIDREQGATEAAKENGMNLWSLIRLKSEGVHWLEEKMDKIEYETVVDYLENEQKYQKPEMQETLRQIALKK
ncbi:MAG: hypothetical protein NWE96_06865 [Candidatus Bathyarchaeota archaeon]|nr:hypothetical protein [Candidatus Bathyarchaeota archaeon]